MGRGPTREQRAASIRAYWAAHYGKPRKRSYTRTTPAARDATRKIVEDYRVRFREALRTLEADAGLRAAYSGKLKLKFFRLVDRLIYDVAADEIRRAVMRAESKPKN